jgi:PEP-CTERM motif
MANDENDGWYALRDWGVKSEGDVNLATNDATSDLWNGHFNWYNRPALVSTNEGGGFDSDYGFKTEYIVTPAMVGQTLTFEIGTREPYGVFDGFLFIQDNNVDLLDMFSQEDLDAGIFPQPVNGDYNNNGAVDAADFVLWRDGGPLANDATAGVQPADYDVWRANFGVGSGNGAAVGASAVPEPTSLLLIATGIAAFATRRRAH